MKDLFVTYELALELKKLGFNEPCFGFYDPTLGKDIILNSNCINPKPSLFSHNSYVVVVSAPLWQQVFDWFYWTHRIKAEPVNFIGDQTTYRIHNGDYNTPIFYLPEESRTACLQKLIEIAKQRKDERTISNV